MKLLKLLLFLFLFATISGCLASKKISEKSIDTKEISSVESTKDSTNITTITEAIDDRTIIPIYQTGDVDLDRRFEELLMKFNQEKTSGNSGYKIVYDPELKQLLLDIKVGQTENTAITTSENTESEKSFTQQTDEYIETRIKMIPWYIWAAIALYFLPKILSGFKTIANPFGTLINNLRKKNTNN